MFGVAALLLVATGARPVAASDPEVPTRVAKAPPYPPGSMLERLSKAPSAKPTPYGFTVTLNTPNGARVLHVVRQGMPAEMVRIMRPDYGGVVTNHAYMEDNFHRLPNAKPTDLVLVVQKGMTPAQTYTTEVHELGHLNPKTGWLADPKNKLWGPASEVDNILRTTLHPEREARIMNLPGGAAAIENERSYLFDSIREQQAGRNGAPPAAQARVVPAPGRPASCEKHKAPPQPSRVAAQVGVGGVFAIGGTVVGKVVEHETGSPAAGLVAGGVVGAAPALVSAAGRAAVVRTMPAMAAGMGARWLTEKATGNKTAGDFAGFGGAAAIGGATGGPPGAVVGVAIHGVSELAGNAIDYKYAKEAGRELDDVRTTQLTNQAYRAVLGRNPDEIGFGASKSFLDQGGTLDALYRSMSESKEAGEIVDRVYRMHLGKAPSDEQMAHGREEMRTLGAMGMEQGVIVARAYALALDRKPDATGDADHREFLRNGGTPEALFAGIARSHEAAAMIGDLYQRHLGRAPSAEEQATQQNHLANGGWIGHVEQELMLTRSYATILDRTPDAGGLANWRRQLAEGKSPAEIAREIAGSDESMNNVALMYLTHAKRLPTTAEMDGARDALAGGAYLGDLERAITK